MAGLSNRSSNPVADVPLGDVVDLNPYFQIYFWSELMRKEVLGWNETDLYNVTRWYVHGFLLVFGSVCNLLCFVVLQTGRLRRSPARLSLSVLTLVDLAILLLVLMPMFIGNVMGTHFLDDVVTCKALLYIQTLCQYLSPWLQVFITIERALAVRFPFLINRFTMRIKIAVLISIFMVLALLLLFVPIEIDIPAYTGEKEAILSMYVLNRLGITSLCYLQSGSSKLFALQPILLPIFHFAIPFVIILVGNLVILNEIRKAASIFGETMGTAHAHAMERLQRERSTTITVCAAGITYLVLMIPGSGFTITLGFFQDDHQKWLAGYSVFRQQMVALLIGYLCQSCYFLNSSINFTIYLLSGSEFRKQILSLLRVMFGCNRQCLNH